MHPVASESAPAGKSPLRWGILSTGEIAATFAAAITEAQGGTLAAVASRDAGRAGAFAERFGIAKAHGAYDDLLCDPDVEAVYIALPHALHAEWAIRAARAGKHVLCEKPLALNHPEAMAMIQSARDNGVVLMEAMAYRLHPQTVGLVELVRERAIGELRLIRATFSFDAGELEPQHRLIDPLLGGGGILDVGAYPVSVSALLAGAALGEANCEPISVQGVARLGPTGIDEYAAACLRFGDGILAEIACGVSLALPDAIELHGSEGRIIALPPAWLSAASRGGKSAPASALLLERQGEPPVRIEFSAERSSYAREADALARSVRDGDAPAIENAESLANMRTLDRWRRAGGVSYEQERIAAGRSAVRRGPVSPGDGATMPLLELPGLPIALSRLVMGADNQPSDAHAAVLFDDFVEHGGSVFDTAFNYDAEMCGGEHCETRLGRWIESRGIRDAVSIVGKGAHTPDCFPGVVRPQLLASLERLRTDRLDMYLLHRDNPEVPVGEFVDALNAVYDEGLVSGFGVSNWTRERFEQAQAYAAAHGRRGLLMISNQFSLAQMREPLWAGSHSASDDDWRQWLREHQVPLLGWSSLARGFLTGAAAAAHSDPQVQRVWHSESNWSRLRRLEELAARRSVAPASLAIAYVLHQPFPTLALIGPRSLEELRRTLGALELALSDEDVAYLTAAAPPALLDQSEPPVGRRTS